MEISYYYTNNIESTNNTVTFVKAFLGCNILNNKDGGIFELYEVYYVRKNLEFHY